MSAAARITRRGAYYGGASVRSVRLTDREWEELERLAALLPVGELRSDRRTDNGRNRSTASKSEAIAHAVRETLERLA